MFKLGAESISNLKGVHPDLVRVVKAAIALTEVDFKVIEGVRTLEQQRKYFTAGKSKTMHSRHLTGHAVDLAALVNGVISWDFNLYFKIAEAMKQAAISEGVTVVWGGGWEPLNSSGSPKKMCDDYVARMRKSGRKPLVDGVHFELDSSVYWS